ncbi:hypothetical protein [Caballeronia sp. GAFFF1]|uniref:hypothetical protein n=1 Tax=Caballeronia sp. GAFFF1 TaxID=2921779 RepID=UPI002028A04A|nr:hypothetical protein [Caballeronia sp. GAFFF1]
MDFVSGAVTRVAGPSATRMRRTLPLHAQAGDTAVTSPTKPYAIAGGRATLLSIQRRNSLSMLKPTLPKHAGFAVNALCKELKETAEFRSIRRSGRGNEHE